MPSCVNHHTLFLTLLYCKSIDSRSVFELWLQIFLAACFTLLTVWLYMSFYSLLFWSIPFLTLFHVISPRFFFLEQNHLPLYGYQGNYRLLSFTLNRPFSPQLVYLSRNSSSIWWDDAVFVRTISGMVGFLLHQSMRSPRNKIQTFFFSSFFFLRPGMWGYGEMP